MIGKSVALATLLAVLVLILVLQTTTPVSAGPVGIIFVILLIYISALGVLTFLLYWGVSLFQRIKYRHLDREAAGVKTFTIRRAYYYASVIALAPVMTIAMQSVGGVSIIELGLVLLFEVIAIIYITKRQT